MISFFSLKITNQSLWQRANARNVSFLTLYGGQFAFSTQLLKVNFLIVNGESLGLGRYGRQCDINLEDSAYLRVGED